MIACLALVKISINTEYYWSKVKNSDLLKTRSHSADIAGVENSSKARIDNRGYNGLNLIYQGIGNPISCPFSATQLK